MHQEVETESCNLALFFLCTQHQYPPVGCIILLICKNSLRALWCSSLRLFFRCHSFASFLFSQIWLVKIVMVVAGDYFGGRGKGQGWEGRGWRLESSSWRLIYLDIVGKPLQNLILHYSSTLEGAPCVLNAERDGGGGGCSGKSVGLLCHRECVAYLSLSCWYFVWRISVY